MFKACRVSQENGKIHSSLVEMSPEDLSPGEVLIHGHYSSLNYKDALAVTGKGKILRKFPLNAGIDVAGVVKSSTDPQWKAGTSVLVTGCGLGETQDGGLAEYVRVPSEWVVPLPQGLSPFEAMALGTAGFTAALCLHRLEVNGQSPEKGPLVITGASGGVGSLALQMLSQKGYQVTAVTGKLEAKDYLKKLGAHEVTSPDHLQLGHRPLESVRWAGAIDNVGGELLSRLLRHIDLWGNVASVGLAGGAEFKNTVMPFILRGVSLLGISSANCPRELRWQLWNRLGSDLKPKNLLETVQKTIGLEQVPQMAQQMLARKTIGRIVVSINPSPTQS